MNVQTTRFLKDSKKYFIDQEIENDPIFIMMFGVSRDGYAYERRLYDFIECLSFLGGIIEVVHVLVTIIIYIR